MAPDRVCHHERMKGPLAVPRILWAALFSSTLIYLVVLELVVIENQGNWEMLVYPLAFAAAAVTGASLVAPRMVRAQGAGEGRYLTSLILALALAESVAILGLVLGFLGAPAEVVVPFFTVSWVLMLIRFPTKAKLDAFAA